MEAHEGNISARVSLLVLEELFDVARWLYVSHLRGRIEHPELPAAAPSAGG